ncbi:MAG: murein transglycosylase [Ponticaulis sp.]|nr:murein transglycosylase [Ponticaulis sp.]
MALVRRFGGLIGGLAFLTACQPEKPPPPEPPVETSTPEPGVASDDLTLTPISFGDIPDWSETPIDPAITAFQQSCRKWENQDPDALLSSRAKYGGVIADWMPACRILPKYVEAGEGRRFFEDYFDAFWVETDEETNRFTGYYEPEVEVSEYPEGDKTTPVPARPDNLIEADLGLFDPSLEGRKVWGQVQGSDLVLYDPRADIQTESDKALAYATPADVFFLQIQGSGRLKLPDGTVFRASFDAHNHRPFESLANHLLRTGEITRAEAGMTGLKAWLGRVGLERAQAAMNVNPRFVWFRRTPIDDPALGPNGAAGLPLTPLGSMAVDLNHHPMGVPMLVRSLIPQTAGVVGDAPTNLLLISQDTGGAITGVRRGDIFFGSGEDAGRVAGSMNQPGRFYVFLPQNLSDRSASGQP